jgi:hypothetical protein
MAETASGYVAFSNVTQHTSLSNYLAVLEKMRKENCPSLEHLVSGTQKREVFSHFKEEVQ